MGNSFPTDPKLEDAEDHAFLSVYTYVIPFVAGFVILINFSVVVSSGLLIKKRVEPRYTYLFLGNVALTDFITGISILFGQLYPPLYRDHTICSIQIGLIVSSTVSSIYSVGLLAIDRFLYIVYGIKYCKWISICRVRLAIGFTWTMAITIGFLPLMGWSGNSYGGRVCWFITIAPAPLIIITVSIGIIPVIVVIVLYSIILYHALANIRKIQYSLYTINSISEKIDSMESLRMFKGRIELPMTKTAPRRKLSQNQAPHKWKAIKVVLFTTFSFLITWTPYFFACVIYVVEDCDYKDPTEFCRTLRLLIASPLTILGLTNSLINPLIYAWWHNGFRTYMRTRIKMCLS
ncbi:unnamed protein product [Ceutorhynchus assimilis]|uniref:G-protein coupled receptors family 1 profile domain-containing protein n=1 Tax=Ceutorhynchus assimilis TaxID=467358 RepID=A0A9P0GPG2_9CUCU|nr:unnamed protein product [Ceutorhynchus assimilis]